MIDDVDYDALAERLTDPDVVVRSAGEVQTGDAAAAMGLSWLLREYGSPEAIQKALIAETGTPGRGDRPTGPEPSL